MKEFACLGVLALGLAAPVVADDLDRLVEGELGGLVSEYKDIHAHAELSHHEERTAGLLADVVPNFRRRWPRVRTATSMA